MNINTDPSLALMQATQSQLGEAAKGLQKAKDPVEGLSEKELAKYDAAAKDFEAMFVSEMMKPMFEGIKVDSTFGGGKGEEIFQGMMLQEYGKMMAETGQLGIANSIKKELIQMQSDATTGGVR